MHDLKTLMLSFHPIIVIETVEEERAHEVLTQIAQDLDVAVFDWSVTQGLCRKPDGRSIHGTVEPIGVVRHLNDLTVMGIFHLRDFARHLDNATTARQFREVSQRFMETRATIVLTGTSITLPPDIEHHAVWYELAAPTKEELRGAVQPVLRSLALRNHVELSITESEMDQLLDAVSGMTLNQARQAVAYAGLIDGSITVEDVRHITNQKAKVIKDGGLLEFFPSEDQQPRIGGFQNLTAWAERARLGFSEEAKTLNLSPPKGILLVGVQGCGKSLAARVIAQRWDLPLLKLDAGRLYDKYIGESEKNFRRAIALAESMAPAVLWVDEIEKAIVGSRGGEDGGVSQRLFGSFLTWLQEKSESVFVVATANDLTHTPPELLRKGRFDEVFFVDLPTESERTEIFGIHLRLRKQDPSGFDLEALVGTTAGFSGAEIEQAVIGGLYRALHDRIPLNTQLLLDEISATVPLSVSKREDIARLRDLAQDRFVPAS